MTNETKTPLIGEATLLFTNIETGAIRKEVRTNNIKYNALYLLTQFLVSNNNTGDFGISPKIVISSVYSPPSKYDWLVPNTPDAQPINGFVDSAQISPQFFKATNTDPAFTQIVNRFNPPIGAPRYVRHITLQQLNSSNSDSNSRENGLNISASISLVPACVQQPTEILDIFYRIITPYSTENLLYPLAHNFLARLSCGTAYPAVFGNTDRLNASYFMFDSTPVIPNMNSTYNYLISLYTGTSLGSNDLDSFLPYYNTQAASYISNVRDLHVTHSIPWGLSTQNGSILTTAHASLPADIYDLRGNVKFVASSHPILASDSSTIQPVHSHSASGTRPFLESSALGVGSGKVIPVSVTPPPSFPELYKINITSSGQTGVATYKFELRHHQGFTGNTYSEKPEILTHVAGQGTITPLIGADQHLPTIKGGHGLTPSEPNGYALDYVYSKNMQQKPYNNDTLISFGLTGLTKVKISSYDYVKNFDSTTSPALPVTNISQVNIDSTGNIWVACRNTGLWKISANDLTVTKITVAGVTDTNCYGVDISSSTIWAIFNGGLCSSTDSGTTWTVYNQTSGTVFNWPGISDSNWSTVAFIRVDFDHVDQRLLIIRKNTASNISSNCACWWSTTTPASSAHIYELYGYTACASVSQQDHLVQSRGGYWTCFATNSNTPGEDTTGTSYLRLLSFNSTSVIQLSGLPNLASSSMQNGFAPDKITGLLKPIILTSSNNSRFGLIEADGTIVNFVSISVSSFSGQHQGYRAIPTGDRAFVYMGGGAMLYPIKYSAGNTAGVYGLYGWVRSFIGLDGTVSGGYFRYLHWQSYGWNGTTWIKNNTGSKTVHTSQEPLINNVTIGFANGATGTSFEATDYYTFGRLVGVWKDNATTLNWNRTLYSLNVVKNISNSGTVTTRAGKTIVPLMSSRSGVSKNLTSGKYHHAYVNVPFTHVARAMTEGFLTGDFELNYNVTTPDCQNSTHTIGGINPQIARELTYYGTTDVLYGFKIDESRQLYYVYQNIGYFTSSGGTPTGTTVTTGDVVSIRRTAGIFYLSYNNTIIHQTSSPYNNPTEVLSYSLSGFSGFTERTIEPMTVAYNGNEYSADLGSSIGTTGIFDPKFVNIIGYPSTLLKGTLNSTPAIMVLTNHPAPAAGEIHINPVAGKAYFNSVDAGKVYNITSAYLQDF